MKKQKNLDADLRREPPHDDDAERTVLGALLINNHVIGLTGDLSRDDFYRDRNGDTFAAIAEMIENETPCDQVTLLHFLASKGKSPSHSYIASLIDDVPAASNVARYAKIVKDSAMLRKAITNANIIIDNCHSPGASPGAIIPNALALFDDIPSDDRIQIISAAQLLNQEPIEADQLLSDTIDRGDKLAIIGNSKQRKSFFLLQLSISLAAGIDNFLHWEIPQKRLVIHCQFEISDNHFQRRVKKMCKAMNITTDDIGERLFIYNGRGRGICGPEGINRLTREIREYKPDVVMLDPLYMLLTGAENAAEDMRDPLHAIDRMIRKLNAGVILVHHDPKGIAGERSTTDRGAGSGILGRWYDACITMTEHKNQDTGLVVLDTVLRNYPPQPSMTAEWTADDETGGYSFHTSDILPEKRTSQRNGSAKREPKDLLPQALEILNGSYMNITAFMDILQQKSKYSRDMVRAFKNFATGGGRTILETRERRGAKLHEKYIGTPEAFKDFDTQNL